MVDSEVLLIHVFIDPSSLCVLCLLFGLAPSPVAASKFSLLVEGDESGLGMGSGAARLRWAAPLCGGGGGVLSKLVFVKLGRFSACFGVLELEVEDTLLAKGNEVELEIEINVEPLEFTFDDTKLLVGGN